MADLKPEDIARLQAFVENCQKCPDIIHMPQLGFFKKYLESLDCKLPTPRSSDSSQKEEKATPSTPEAEKTSAPMEEESEESDVEINNDGVIEPETESLPVIYLHEEGKEISEEDMDKSGEKRSEAMSAMGDGDLPKAVELFSEAIQLNPSSAALYAKRANALLKQNRVTATIEDCSHAISMNPDSALAHKLRGKAYRLLGKWVEAARDLRLACKLDCDEQAIEWLAEVEENAKKLEEHERKKLRKKVQKEDDERRERVRKAKLAQEEARKKADEEARKMPPGGMPSFGGMGGMFGGMGGAPGGMGGAPEGMGGMPDFSGLASDPDLLQAFTDPEVSAAFQDVSSNPSNIFKYKDNPKVTTVINKLMKKFGDGGAGGPMGGMGGMGGGMPFGGMGGMGEGMPDFDGAPTGGAPQSSSKPPTVPSDELD